MDDNSEVAGKEPGVGVVRAPRISKLSAPSAPSASPTIISINPFKCRVWALHDRLDDYVNEESCKAEIESFAAHGQLVPTLGRALRNDPDYDVEIIYGARRLFVAQHLGVALKVELREMSDREAIVAMDIENRHRKDISAYERGRTYQRWLRAMHFASQDDIARALNVSSSQVSRLLKLSQLPSVIVAAFASPLDIREGWGIELYRAWHEKGLQGLMAQRARAIAERVPRLSAAEVYERLLAPPGGGLVIRAQRRDEVVRSAEGALLFRIRHQRKVVALLVPAASIVPKNLDRVRRALSEILQDVSM
ncbi:MAG TPA: ParB/RepB/Spo0J family partition protein [Steroidobacteraceae bacterium]|nr:ParB/RepB/Spo0J family partition protein [Steroidobacteraceae bacterium]